MVGGGRMRILKRGSFGLLALAALALGVLGNDALAPPRHAAAAAVPAAPVLSGTAQLLAISLTWTTPDNGVTIKGHAIYRGTTSGGETLLTRVNAPAQSYVDRSAPSGVQHFYYVRALNDANEEGPPSNEVAATPIPVTVTLSPTPGTGTIVLSWTISPPEAVSLFGRGYRLERGTVSDALTFLADVDYPATGTVDSTAVPGTTYFYRVTAVNTLGEWPVSNVASATAATYAGGVPPAPVLSASPGFWWISLRWTPSDGSYPVTSYRLYRTTTMGAIQDEFARTGFNTSYADTAIVPGTTYHYWVQAENASGLGPPSNVVQVVAPATVPSAPLSFVALAPTPTGATLSWSPPSSNGGSPITGYRVHRRIHESTDYVEFDVGIVTTHLDSTASPGSNYLYLVAARNAVGIGPWSNSAVVTIPIITTPSAPQNLTAATSKGKGIDLVWTPPASNGGAAVTSYRVYRGSTHIGTVTSTAFKDTAAPRGASCYTVRAVNSAGEGAASNEACAKAR
jgi:fibronectin type 3 domain-containing protein